MVTNNFCYDNGQLIDRGGCESTTSAMIFDETVPLLDNCTWARDNGQAFEGTYSFLCTKIAGGGSSSAQIVDSNSTSDLHGLIPGLEYKYTVQIYIPSGSILGSEVVLYIWDYQGGWVADSQAAANLYDQWQEVTVTRTIRAAATGIQIWINTPGAASAGEQFWADNLRFQPLGVHNEHLQNFLDNGTDTQVG